jgi:hypothetical protein
MLPSLTAGAGFAAHRYCFRSAWHIAPDQLTIASAHDGAPPNSTSSTEGVSDVPPLASCSSPRTSDSSLACVVVELTAAGLASTPLRQRVRAISASVRAQQTCEMHVLVGGFFPASVCMSTRLSLIKSRNLESKHSPHEPCYSILVRNHGVRRCMYALLLLRLRPGGARLRAI